MAINVLGQQINFQMDYTKLIICTNCIILCMQELLQQQQRREREMTSLSHQVDRLQLKNEELLRKIDKLKHEHQNSPREGKLFLNMVDLQSVLR